MKPNYELRCSITANLEAIRGLVRRHARCGGLRGERLDDLVLAVNEAVTNVLDHAHGTGTVTLRSSGDGIAVDIEDHAGRLTSDHLAKAEIDPIGSHGYGLWVIQDLCDRVEVQQNEKGSRLRLHMSRYAA
ncbi:ATP-binding protein [Nonomuraea sp. NPDC050404]|uniref:ATP-binding protein n=1 Tax=Nonomuraea sp. NPDC050404 TaxID=3155783 RepID=UPI0033E63A7A